MSESTLSGYCLQLSEIFGSELLLHVQVAQLQLEVRSLRAAVTAAEASETRGTPRLLLSSVFAAAGALLTALAVMAILPGAHESSLYQPRGQHKLDALATQVFCACHPGCSSSCRPTLTQAQVALLEPAWPAVSYSSRTLHQRC